MSLARSMLDSGTARAATMMLALALLAPGLFAETLEVPDDHDTIQEAIDEAVDGDVVLVSAGTYEENIDFLGKAITVESVDGPEETIIDGQFLTLDDERGSVVSFLNGEGPDSQLTGFTLENGVGHLVPGVPRTPMTRGSCTASPIPPTCSAGSSVGTPRPLPPVSRAAVRTTPTMISAARSR